MLLIGQPAAALFGLFLVGLGVANGVPLMFSAAGRQPDTPPGPGIAAVSSMGSLGFLAGPPIIGFLADAISLPWALALLILGAVVVFALARARRRPARAATPGRRRAMTLRRRHLRPRRRAGRLDAPPTGAWARWGARHGLDGAAIQAANHGRPAARGDRRARRRRRSSTPRPRCLLDAEVADTRRRRRAARRRRRARAAASSRSRRRARRRWRARASAAAGLPVPDVLVTADQVARGKPAPDPYLLAAERLGVDPADCLVLEDAPGGVAAGRAAGHDGVGGDDHARARRARRRAPRGRRAAGAPGRTQAGLGEPVHLHLAPGDLRGDRGEAVLDRHDPRCDRVGPGVRGHLRRRAPRRSRWIPHYLPQWTTSAASAARHRVGGGRLAC